MIIKDELHQLIQSMSRTEKRYFKVQAKKSGDEKSNYVRLFNAINENKSTIDGFDFRTIQHNQDLDWGNTIGALRWNHLFSDRLFANTTLTFSKFWFKYLYSIYYLYGIVITLY
mgnify:CR=1 FL=1